MGDEAERRAVATEISAVTGGPFRSVNGIPVFPAAVLGDKERRAQFLHVFDRLVARLRDADA